MNKIGKILQNDIASNYFRYSQFTDFRELQFSQIIKLVNCTYTHTLHDYLEQYAALFSLICHCFVKGKKVELFSAPEWLGWLAVAYLFADIAV